MMGTAKCEAWRKARSVHLYNDCIFNMWMHQKRCFLTNSHDSLLGFELRTTDEAFILHLLKTHAKFCLEYCSNSVDDTSSKPTKVEQFNLAGTGTTSRPIILQVTRRKDDSLGWQSAFVATSSDDSREDEMNMDADSGPEPPTVGMVEMAGKGRNHQSGDALSCQGSYDARGSDHSDEQPENMESQEQPRGVIVEVKTEPEDQNEDVSSCQVPYYARISNQSDEDPENMDLQDEQRGVIADVKTEPEDQNEDAMSYQGPYDARSSDHSDEHPENMEPQDQPRGMMMELKTEPQHQNEGNVSCSTEEENTLSGALEPTVISHGELDVIPPMKTARIVLKKLDIQAMSAPCICQETVIGNTSLHRLRGEADYCLVKCEVCSRYISHVGPHLGQSSDMERDDAAGREGSLAARNTGTALGLTGIGSDTEVNSALGVTGTGTDAEVNGSPQAEDATRSASDQATTCSSQPEDVQSPGFDLGSRKERKIDRNNTLPCHVCPKMIKVRKVTDHIRKHINKDKEKPFKCRVCAEEFEYRYELKYHILDKMVKDHVSARSESWLAAHVRRNSSQKLFHCKVCAMAFHKKRKVRRHTKRRHGKTPFCCVECPKAFHRRRDLISHAKSHYQDRISSVEVSDAHVRRNSDQRLVHCEVCLKAFPNERKLRRHTKQSHSKKPFSCVECLVAFRKKCDLKNHAKLHFQEQILSVEVSSKLSHYELSLRKHLKLHTVN